MESVKEQRICVTSKFCFKVGKTAAEACNVMCEAYSDDAFIQTMTYERLKRSKNGRSSTDESEWSG
jgi:hypothetical protein